MLSTLPLTISALDGLIDQNEFFNKTVASKDVSGYYLIKKGEFAYNKSYSNGYPWGAVKRLNKYDMGVLSTLYIVFKPKDVNSDFLEKYYDTTGWYKEVQQRAAEGARNHGLLNITASDFFDTELKIPKSKVEQQKIGSFFESLDHLITLHQCKLNNLEMLVNSFYQELFPKNNEKIPSIRFNGFINEWNYNMLGKLGNTFTGLSGKTKEDFGHGNAKFVTYMNVFNNPITNINETDYVEIDDKQNQVEFGDVFFTTSSETPEEVGMTSVWLGNANNIYLNSFCFGYRPLIEIDPYYIAFLLRSLFIRKKIMFLAQGISRYNISKNKVMEINIPIPELSEQEQIGHLLKILNTHIIFQQNQLNNLKIIKKSLLNKMFI